MTSIPDSTPAAIRHLAELHHAGAIDRETFIDAVVDLTWEPDVAAAVDALYGAVYGHLIEIGLADEVVERKSRMRRLARQFQAGELNRDAFIEAMLAFEWNPSRQQLPPPPELLQATLPEKTAWGLARIADPVIPDSVDELSYLTASRIIDLPTKSEIYRRWFDRPSKKRGGNT